MKNISFLFGLVLAVGMAILGNVIPDSIQATEQLRSVEHELQMGACLGGAMIVLVLMKLLRFRWSMAILIGVFFGLGLWANVNEGVSFAEVARQALGR